MENLIDMWREMMHCGENGLRGPTAERDTELGRRLMAERMRKDHVVQEHEHFRVQYQRKRAMLPGGGNFMMTTALAEESTTVSAPLRSLKIITLPELILGERHHGRVLYGRVCAKPFKIVSVQTVLEDATGHGVRVHMYNVLPSTASLLEVEACFPLGMRVAIKEPLFKISLDGKPSVRVDNPADLLLDEGKEDEGNSPPDLNNPEKIEKDLETIRCEGNRLFDVQNWASAVNKYSKCIDLAVRTQTEMDGITNNKYIKSDEFSRVTMLAYSNRAEAKLRLQAFEGALCDVDKALEFDPKHVKTLVRKGKAAHGLGLFEKACTVFKTALAQAPRHADAILECLAVSTTLYEQSQHGKYNLSDYYSRGCIGDISSLQWADFIGPVEIRRVPYGCGRRGLFATRAVEAGELLLVSNPMAIAREKRDTSRLFLDIQHKVRGSSKSNINDATQHDLITHLANGVMPSKRKIAQLYSLAIDGKQEMEIPSMELFRPGSQWIPANADKLAVNVGLIREIVSLNSFGNNGGTDLTQLGKQAQVERLSGLWVLPAMVNHSCAPNCSFTLIGDVMFIRSFRGISDGEELTISYFDICQSVEARQAKAKNWLFTCQCERCSLEETLKPQLSRVSKRCPALEEAATAESRQNIHSRTTMKGLAKLVPEFEKVIVKLNYKQQSWIRASYPRAYLAKFVFAKDEHDAQSRILALRILVDSSTVIFSNPMTVELSAMLLREVEQRYSKRSPTYKLADERVLGIYKTVYGNEPNKILHKLMISNLLRLGTGC